MVRGETVASDAVHIDSEVATNVLRIFDDAHEYVVVVSPWLELWGHAKNAVEKAQRRGIKKIQFIIRKNAKPSDAQKRDVSWLRERGVELYQAERLHAKIYLNEKTVLLSSMNLMESSALNSLEVAYTLTDKASQDRVRQYVSQHIMGIASNVGAQSPTPRASTTKLPAPSTAPRTQAAKPTRRTSKVEGFCIRRRESIDLNPDKPLCRHCYDEWNQYQKSDYVEEFCHACGRKAKTTILKPLCPRCYATVR